MRIFKTTVWAAMLALLVGCGSGGDENTLTPPPPDPDGNDGTPPTVVVSSIEVLTSNPQIPSDGGVPVTITALLRDANNNFVGNQNVTFAADSGGLSVTQPAGGNTAPQAVTDQNGRATAELTAAGDPTNRIITVTATSGDLSSTVQVEVTGTQLTITGPTSLVQGAQADYTIVLADAAGDGIPNQPITLTSSLGNTLSTTTLDTDFSGQAQVQYTAVNGGSDSLQASALGESAASTIAISADTFSFSQPTPNTEINLGESANVVVSWVQNNAPVVGSTVVFSTTRGSVSPASVITDANGTATTTVTANNSGPANITATAVGGPVATVPIEFLAITPDTIEVQADPFTVSPNSQSTITAVVRDPNGNLVKNKGVTFLLEDVTGGTLSVSSAITDSQGRAQTFYTSSASVSAVDGVTVTAVVDEDPTITDSVSLTVAGREVFFTFGTGNTVAEPNEAQYAKLFVVQVTDADGRPVQEVDVSMSVVSVRYVKGFYWANSGTDSWVRFSRARCDDEDINRNGQLDDGEDFNNSGSIEAGNIVTVSPGSFISDTLGEGQVTLRYAQEFAGWLEIELQARASVQGTEFSEKAFFIINGAASDFNDLEIAPPARDVVVEDLVTADIPDVVLNGISISGDVANLFSSPFGYNNDCSVWEFASP